MRVLSISNRRRKSWKVISELLKRIEGVERERGQLLMSRGFKTGGALGSEILYIEAWHHADRVEHPSSETGLDVGMGRKSYCVSHIEWRHVTLQRA